MKKVEIINDAVFAINGVPYQRGSVGLSVNGDRVSMFEAQANNRLYIDRVLFSDYRDGADQPFATLEDLLVYLRNTIMI